MSTTDDVAGLVERFLEVWKAAKGAPFDLVPEDGAIARLALFMHDNGNAMADALQSQAAEIARLRGTMDSRERLARAISDARLWAGAWDKMGEPERAFFLEQAEKFLASDWLRDTLAAERRAGFIAGRDAAAKVAQAHYDKATWHKPGEQFAASIKAIRNLEPEATDEI